MMRGTVYLVADGVPWARYVLMFAVSSAAEFQAKAPSAFEHGTDTRLEFGPIGPPWRKG